MGPNINITSFINNLTVTDYFEIDNLRFEIINRNIDLDSSFTNLSNALKFKKIIINEIDESGNVPELICKNLSPDYILILAGEEIVGAKQNRIVNASFILGPNKELKIPVSCVEEGRWAYKSRHFSKGTNAYPDLKRKLYEDVITNRDYGQGNLSNQSRIWEDIRMKERYFNKFSNTGAMHDLYEESKDIEHFIRSKKDINGSGIVTFINGSVASFDVLPNKVFFNQIFPELVRSSYQQALMFKNTSKTYSYFFSTTMFINKLKTLYSTPFNGVGEGFNNSIKSNQISGDFLSLNDDVIHFYTFPKTIN